MMPITIINRYIFRELIPPFAISLFFLTFVFLMTRIPDITNMVVNYNADLTAIVMMILYTLPRFLEFTIPMSVMISVLLTFMRMSGENEIVALKGAGTSLYRLLPPVLVFCLLGTLLTMWVTVFGVSWGKLAIKKTSLELARSSIDVALQERQFNANLPGYMIYVSSVDMQTKDLTDVFVEDRTTPGMTSVTVAPSGKLIRSAAGDAFTIRLYNGMINQVNNTDNSVNTVHFGHYDFSVDLAAMQKGPGKINKELDERSLPDLLRYIRSEIKDEVHMSAALMVLHEKFSIPVACLSLGLLAFPLGIQSLSLRRSSGFGMGIFFFLLYYFLLAAGWSAGETGYFPPVLGMWLPNVIMGGAGAYMLVRNAREKPVRMPNVLRRLIRGLQNRLTRIRSGRAAESTGE